MRRTRDNQDCHTPPSPWWEGVTPADGVRYERARRLTQEDAGAEVERMKFRDTQE